MSVLQVEVERALVEAEQEAELAALQREKDGLEDLHGKMDALESRAQTEKDKVGGGTRTSCRCGASM